MTAPHYIGFVGANRALSDELLQLERRISGCRLVAPVATKNERDITDKSIQELAAALTGRLERDKSVAEAARLSIWAYEPRSPADLSSMWNTFGRSGWIEFVPSDLRDKIVPSRNYIESRARDVEKFLYRVSSHVFIKRKTSPTPIPFVNFKSRALEELRSYWYRHLGENDITAWLQSTHDRFRMAHTKKKNSDGKKDGGILHVDDRGLNFEPARNEICHGKPHPVGDSGECFLSGRFRFGAALFPGFSLRGRNR